MTKTFWPVGSTTRAFAISLVLWLGAGAAPASTVLEGTLFSMDIEDDFIPDPVEEETLEFLRDPRAKVDHVRTTTFNQESGLLGLAWAEELTPNQPLALWGVGARLRSVHAALEHALGSGPIQRTRLSLGRMGKRPAYQETVTIDIDGFAFIGEVLLIGGKDERIALILVAQDGEAPQTSEAKSLIETARYDDAGFTETLVLSGS